MNGFCAETGGGVTILAVSKLGIPVSTTHTITGAIVGVGVVNRMRSVRWIVAGRIIWAWVLTIPSPVSSPLCATSPSEDSSTKPATGPPPLEI